MDSSSQPTRAPAEDSPTCKAVLHAGKTVKEILHVVPNTLVAPQTHTRTTPTRSSALVK